VRVDDAFCLARAQMLTLLLQLVLMVLVDMIQRRLARMTRRGGD